MMAKKEAAGFFLEKSGGLHGSELVVVTMRQDLPWNKQQATTTAKKCVQTEPFLQPGLRSGSQGGALVQGRCKEEAWSWFRCLHVDS
jgi:hypothetical protein